MRERCEFGNREQIAAAAERPQCQLALRAEDAAFVAERIFPGPLAGLVYDPSTCTYVPAPDADAGADASPDADAGVDADASP